MATCYSCGSYHSGLGKCATCQLKDSVDKQTQVIRDAESRRIAEKELAELTQHIIVRGIEKERLTSNIIILGNEFMETSYQIFSPHYFDEIDVLDRKKSISFARDMFATNALFFYFYNYKNGLDTWLVSFYEKNWSDISYEQGAYIGANDRAYRIYTTCSELIAKPESILDRPGFEKHKQQKDDYDKMRKIILIVNILCFIGLGRSLLLMDWFTMEQAKTFCVSALCLSLSAFVFFQFKKVDPHLLVKKYIDSTPFSKIKEYVENIKQKSEAFDKAVSGIGPTDYRTLAKLVKYGDENFKSYMTPELVKELREFKL